MKSSAIASGLLALGAFFSAKGGHAATVIPVIATGQSVVVSGVETPIEGIMEAVLLDDGSILAELQLGQADSAWFHIPRGSGDAFDASTPTLLIREGENFGGDRTVHTYYLHGQWTYGSGLVMGTRVGTVGDTNGVYRRAPGLSSEVAKIGDDCPGGDVGEIVTNLEIGAVSNTGYIYFHNPCSSTSLAVARPDDTLVALKDNAPLAVADIPENEPDWVPVLRKMWVHSAQDHRVWVWAEVGCGDIADDTVNNFSANQCPAGWPMGAYYEIDVDTGARTLLWIMSDGLTGYTFASPGSFSRLRANAAGDIIAFGTTDDPAGATLGPDFIALKLADELDFKVVAHAGDPVEGVGGVIRYFRAPQGVDDDELDEPRAYVDALGRVVFVARVQTDTLGFGCILRADGESGIEAVVCHEDEVPGPAAGWVIDSTVPPNFFSASANGRGIAQWRTRDPEGLFRQTLLVENADGEFEVVAHSGQVVDVLGQPFSIAGDATDTYFGAFDIPIVLDPGGQDDGFGRQLSVDGKTLLIANEGYGDGNFVLFLVDADGVAIVPGSATISVDVLPLVGETAPTVEGETLHWGTQAMVRVVVEASEGDTIQGMDITGTFSLPVEPHPILAPLSTYQPVGCELSTTATGATGFTCQASEQTVSGPATATLDIPILLPVAEAGTSFTVDVTGTVILYTDSAEVAGSVARTPEVAGLADLKLFSSRGEKLQYFTIENQSDVDATGVHFSLEGMKNIGNASFTYGRGVCQITGLQEGLECDIGTIEAGEQVSIEIELNSGGHGPWTATVWSSTTDPTPEDNTISEGAFDTTCTCVRPASSYPYSFAFVLLALGLVRRRGPRRVRGGLGHALPSEHQKLQS